MMANFETFTTQIKFKTPHQHLHHHHHHHHPPNPMYLFPSHPSFPFLINPTPMSFTFFISLTHLLLSLIIPFSSPQPTTLPQHHHHHHHHHHSLSTDKTSLLHFKTSLQFDPQSKLYNWNESTNVCSFFGVRCNKWHHRVTALNLSHCSLTGSISPSLANLTRLKILDLSTNSLSGDILTDLSSLRNLLILNLSENQLNSRIPQSLTLLTNLIHLRLSHCSLIGTIPPFLTNLSCLKLLDLSDNSLSGVIPTNLSQSLQFIDLSGNQLHDQIPRSFGHLTKLIFLKLTNNHLTGQIPVFAIYNLTSLQYLDLSNNSLIGHIPPEIGNHQHNLQVLYLYLNHLTGKIPSSLSNCSLLLDIDLENNQLSGELPINIIEKTPGLKYLHLSDNHLVSSDNNTNLAPFFLALSNCTKLSELELARNNLGGDLWSSMIGELGINIENIYLEENRITGSIPANLANLTNLYWLNLSSNFLKGTIPMEFKFLKNLQRLCLSNNLLGDAIPGEISEMSKMGVLDLSQNGFSSVIPASLGNLSQLWKLCLYKNQLSGAIPSSLGRCSSLGALDLSHNRLTGIIPTEIEGLMNMNFYLNLSHNFLQGSLPYGLSKLTLVLAIDLSSNNLTGNIIPQLASLVTIELLDLSHNSLQGSIPGWMGNLISLRFLDLSDNQLSGSIPQSLKHCKNLVFLNLSCNDLNGSIPTGEIFDSFTYRSYLGNPNLCGSIPGIPKCSHGNKKSHKFLILLSTIISATVFILTVGCVVGYRMIRKVTNVLSRREGGVNRSLPRLRSSYPRITYRELVEATNGFNEQMLIGSGSFGHVYKGTLKDGSIVAVKVLHLQTGNSTKSFNRECQVLKRIRHRNLMKIITACSLPDFKALVLPFMANGSLEDHLYPRGQNPNSSELSLIERVHICSDIAEGMAYLHHHSPIQVVHCDLKPSNILLNDDMMALVSDFGIARLVMNVGMGNTGAGAESTTNSTANMLCGSIGYIAPEYGLGSNPSARGDVYSFGIVVLETITRTRPIDDMFAAGLSLQRWVKSHYPARVDKVIDPSLKRAARDQSPEVKKMWECAITELLELGLLCTQEAPSTRPTMMDAADDLDRLKRYLAGDTTATFASSLGISSSTIVEDD